MTEPANYTDRNNEFDKYDEPRLHMERLMRVRLIEFDISMRILVPLEEAGIRTLGDLLNHSRQDILAVKNIGVGSLLKIDLLLKRLGLDYKKAVI